MELFIILVTFILFGFSVNLPEVKGKCKISDYGHLIEVHKECTFKHHHIDHLNALHKMVTGKQMVGVFNSFCKERGEVHSCVADELERQSCPSSVKFHFEELAKTSEWYCDGDKVKAVISDIYKDIPAVPVIHSNDPCMTIIKERKQKCYVMTILRLSFSGVKDIVEKQAEVVGSMLCAINGLKDKENCPLSNGVLSTTLAYSHSLVPPTLGVNVSQIILDMKKFVDKYSG